MYKLKILILLLFFACKENKTENKSNTFLEKAKGKKFKIRNSEKLFFSFDNKNKKSFGFLKSEMSESLGPNSVTFNNGYLYVTDPVHENVKKINVTSGEKMISSKLGYSNFILSSLAEFKNQIFVLSEGNLVFQIDTNLNIIKEIELKDFKGAKNYFDTNRKFEIYKNVNQNENNRFTINTLTLDEDDLVFFETEHTFSYDEYIKTPYCPKNNNSRGKIYRIESAKGELNLINQYGHFELKEKIPEVYDYYDCNNLFFNENTIVYFDISEKGILFTTLFY